MRHLWTLLSGDRRQRGSGTALRLVRTAHDVGTDLERLLLVMFWVVFVVGTIVAIAEIAQLNSLFSPASSPLLR